MADEQEIVQALRQFIAESSPEELRESFRPGGDALQVLVLLRNAQNVQQIMFEKNLKVFGGINEYVEDFLPAVLQRLSTVSFAERENTKKGIRIMIDKMLNTEGLSAENRARLQDALNGPVRSENTAPAAGKRRRRRKTRRV